MILASGWKGVPAIHRLMEDFALCSGLALNMRKTVVVPLELGDPEDHREKLLRAAPSWAAVSLKHSAKYLGFHLGPGSGTDSWLQAARKFSERAKLWGDADGGSMLMISAYKVYVVSVLLFVLQLEDLPQDWKDLERKAAQHILPGPYRWLPMPLAHDLKKLGLPGEIPDLEELRPAIRLRVLRSLTNHPIKMDLEHMQRQLALSHRRSDFIVRAATWAAWYRDSYTSKLLQAKEEFRRLGKNITSIEHDLTGGEQRPWTKALAIKAQTQFQKEAGRQLKGALGGRRGRAEMLLDTRLRRWKMEVLPGRRAERTLKAMWAVRGQIPPRCQFGILRALLNGWMTGRRFGQTQGDNACCRLGCQEKDSIEHYSSCPIAASVASSWLGLLRRETPEARLADFLLASTFSTKEELRRRALWTGVVYMWHNLCRHARGLTTNTRRLEALRHCLRDALGSTCTTTSAAHTEVEGRIPQ